MIFFVRGNRRQKSNFHSFKKIVKAYFFPKISFYNNYESYKKKIYKNYNTCLNNYV